MVTLDKRSIAVGMAIGRYNCEINTEYMPAVWNDPGIYDYFYIDYKRAVGTFSYGRFRNSSALVGTTGELIPSNAEQVSPRVYKIHCDISQELQVRIFSNEGRGLVFADGEPVPGFGVSFWVDEAAPHELPYIYDSGKLEVETFNAPEGLAISVFGMHPIGGMMDTAALPEPYDHATRESVGVEYF